MARSQMISRKLDSSAKVAACLLSAICCAHASAASLQEVTDAAMRNRIGTVVVLDVSTGRILAAHRLDLAARTLARPGSTIKPFTLLALRNSKKLRPGETLLCRRSVILGGRRLHCSHVPISTPLDADLALAYSCNSFFAQAAARLHPTDLPQTFERAGLSTRTGLAPGEAIGNVGRPSTLEGRQLQALGEADIQITPLALLMAYRSLAKHRLAGLLSATTVGTGRLAASSKMPVAGKTGTTDRHAWFAGYAPADAPRVALVVFLSGGTGGADAAPVARQILAALEQVEDVRPGKITLRIHSQPAPTAMLLDDYVAGVLAGESSNFRSEESLKAMAVAVRTYAVRFRGRHKKEGFDFCDTTHCQDFRPGATTLRLENAAVATSGELLWYDGKPAATYYHQDCGGATEAAGEVWPELREPYLPYRTDTFCTQLGRSPWRGELQKEDVRRALEHEGFKASSPPSGSIVAEEYTPSGRVRRIRLGNLRLAASTLRFAVGRNLGWQHIRSDRYVVRDAGNSFVFEGYGAGHGVGLCQRGTARRGEAGRSYRQILADYFPGTKLGLTAQGLQWQSLGGERVEVLSTRPHEHHGLVSVADNLMRDLERDVGLTYSFRPQIRIYPTVAVFRDATGEPGWIAASTRGQVIRLQPLSSSLMRATLRHELLHVLVENRAHPTLPWWFREGIVLALNERHEPTSRSYESARSRVNDLLRSYGKGTVLGWVSRGLPPELK